MPKHQKHRPHVYQDLAGTRSHRLLVLRPVGMKNHKRMWLCRCDCGREVELSTSHIQGGQVSCGCAKGEARHGHSRRGKNGSREYLAWMGMRSRCRNPNFPAWHRYGGRGVAVCDRWSDSFEAFLEDMGPCPPGLTLDRIDNDRGYEPGNCRWVSMRVQNRNRHNNRRLTHNGETLTVAEWSERLGFANAGGVAIRLSRGWSVERAVTEPLRKNWGHAR